MHQVNDVGIPKITAAYAKFAKDSCPATRWTSRNLPVPNTRSRRIVDSQFEKLFFTAE